MTQGEPTIEVAEETVRPGTALYDTEFDRVLWVSDIANYEVTIETAESYADEDPIWWSGDGDPTRVSDGSSLTLDRFEALVDEGRFEVGPQPTEPDVPR